MLRGAIVLLRPRSRGARPLLKRVVGLPGERVHLLGARVRVQGRLLAEPYVDPRAGLQPLPDREWTLAAGQYLVLGDARDDSLDSRAFGPVSASAILAVAILPV